MLLAACNQSEETDMAELIRYREGKNPEQSSPESKELKTVYKNKDLNFKINATASEQISFKESTNDDFYLILCFDEQTTSCGEGLDSWNTIRVLSYPNLAQKITLQPNKDLYQEINQAYPQQDPLTHEVLSENKKPRLEKINGKEWYVSEEQDSHGQYVVHHLINQDKLYIISIGSQRSKEYIEKVMASFSLL